MVLSSCGFQWQRPSIRSQSRGDGLDGWLQNKVDLNGENERGVISETLSNADIIGAATIDFNFLALSFASVVSFT